MRTLTPLLVGGALVLALWGPAVAETQTTTTVPAAHAAQPGCPPLTGMATMDPAMRARMMAGMQDMMVMMQNTTAWTPMGLVVLQGNRLLHYSTDLQLRHQVTLPIPQTAIATGTPGTTGTTTLPEAQPLRSLIPVQILPADNNSIIVVRGQQVLRYDRDFRLMAQATLPILPPLTVAEANAICPSCTQMELFAMTNWGMPMPAGTTTGSAAGTTGTGVATAP